MKSVKGTETEKNLLKAFAGESQARNRYTYFASRARKDGFVQIADIFEETANQEKEHAERFFKFLEGGELEITASFPAGVIGTTEENLAEAANGEYDEWHNLYPAFAQKAREEGFPAIAYVWDHVCVAGTRLRKPAPPVRTRGLILKSSRKTGKSRFILKYSETAEAIPLSFLFYPDTIFSVKYLVKNAFSMNPSGF